MHWRRASARPAARLEGAGLPQRATVRRKVVPMKLHKIAAIAALVAAGSAHADISLLDASMYPTLVGSNGATIGGVTFGTNAGKTFVEKTKGGFSGLGVSGGRTGDEIDMDETVGMGWANGLTITSFSVGVLYNAAGVRRLCRDRQGHCPQWRRRRRRGPAAGGCHQQHAGHLHHSRQPGSGSRHQPVAGHRERGRRLDRAEPLRQRPGHQPALHRVGKLAVRHPELAAPTSPTTP